MEQEPRRKGPRSPGEDSDSLRRRKKYERSPSSPRRRYRRSPSRSRSSSRERSVRRKDNSREHEWKSNMQTSNKTSNPPPAPGYPPPVINQYNTAPPPNTSQPPPPIQYAQGYGNYNYNYNQSYPDYTGYQQAAGYRNDYPPANWQGNVPYNSQQQAAAAAAAAAVAAAAAAANMPPGSRGEPPQQRVVDPVAQAALLAAASNRPEEAKKEAIAAELKQQKATLAKQREEYFKKSSTLQRELEILRKQCEEIGKEGGRENTRIIKENQKLQIEIQNKMKSIHNVIDMLTGIIGDKLTVDDLKVKYRPESINRSKSPKDSFSSGKSNTPKSDEKDIEKPAFNFVHYDPEMHWCKTCDIFPKTAKEYLNHLHSNEHKEVCLERKIVDMPWHDSKLDGLEKEVPYFPNLPTKRTPIKGLQFFSPSTAWYCKLCHAWIGDLHCASLHLKSRRHSENYIRFVDQNPHWETDWMADREKAFSDDKHKQIQMEIQKQKEEIPSNKSDRKKAKKNKKNKKKAKKRKTKSSNSDSSSDSDSNDSDSNNGNGSVGMEDASRSIRVAMRNKMKGSSQSLHNSDNSYGNHDQMDEREMGNSLRDKMKSKQNTDNNMQCNKDKNSESDLQAWGPKEPPKTFWLKKDEENKTVPIPNIGTMKPEEMPKPHMGFWTKQQVMPVKTAEKDKDKDRDDDRDRDRDRYKEDRGGYGNKWDRRPDDKYDRNYRDDRYDNNRRRGGGGQRNRDTYYDNRNRRRDSNDSPRHDRNYRDNSPKRGYDKYKGDDDMSDEKKSNDNNHKQKKQNSGNQGKKSAQVVKGKLPFIGRLPLFKKKDDPKPEKELTALPYTTSKFEDTPKVSSDIINPPGVVHVPKLATPLALPNNQGAINKVQQMKVLVAPPPPALNNKQQVAAEVVDMEIEDQSEDTVIEQTADANKNASKPAPSMPNTSRPPPGYPAKKPEAKPTPFTHTGPPPPFVTNTFMHPTSQPPPVQPMPFMHQMQIPPPGMFSNPPPPIPTATDVPPPCMPVVPTMGGVPGVPGVPVVAGPPGMPGVVPGMPIVTPVVEGQPSETTEHTEKRPDGAPLPEDLQEALDIIFPTDSEEAARQAAQQNNQDNRIMYGSMYNMLGCVGYGPDYMDQPPPEITQQEPENEEAPGADDLKMLGIDEGDTIL